MIVLLTLLLSFQEPLDLPGPAPRAERPPSPVTTPVAEPVREAPGSDVPAADRGPAPDHEPASQPSSRATGATPGPAPAPLGGPIVEEGPGEPMPMPRAGGSAGGASADRATSSPEPTAGAARGDLLGRVLDRLGGVRAFEDLGSLAVQRRLEALDSRGRQLFSHRFWHWARLDGDRPADEVQWREAMTFGRRDGRTWVRLDDLERPDLEDSVVQELEVWGFLLRFPFCLRDGERWLALPEERVDRDGRSWLRLRLVDRHGDGASCELWLDPATLVPREAVLERGGRSRRLRFDQWVPVVDGGPRLPQRRTVLGEDGRTPSLEIHWELARQRKWR